MVSILKLKNMRADLSKIQLPLKEAIIDCGCFTLKNFKENFTYHVSTKENF